VQGVRAYVENYGHLRDDLLQMVDEVRGRPAVAQAAMKCGANFSLQRAAGGAPAFTAAGICRHTTSLAVQL